METSMNVKRVIGILLLAVGIFVIFYANYQKGRVAAAGERAYEQINQGGSLFQGSPIGGAVTGSMKKKTASEMAKYNQMLQNLLIGGIIVAVVGAGLIVFCKPKKKKKR
jgi:uncharacterized protein YjeT (DUF2065 family)